MQKLDAFPYTCMVIWGLFTPKSSHVGHVTTQELIRLYNTGNVQGLRANQIAALSTDGVLFPKSIQNMSEISEVSEVSKLCPKFEHCFYRNIANFW